ncbi:hypothetical protein JHW43_008564 [Diplocarpon mali]|nr:hypothetical protein JHW43_008564 [Diplocarpon mali]
MEKPTLLPDGGASRFPSTRSWSAGAEQLGLGLRGDRTPSREPGPGSFVLSPVWSSDHGLRFESSVFVNFGRLGPASADESRLGELDTFAMQYHVFSHGAGTVPLVDGKDKAIRWRVGRQTKSRSVASRRRAFAAPSGARRNHLELQYLHRAGILAPER